MVDPPVPPPAGPAMPSPPAHAPPVPASDQPTPQVPAAPQAHVGQQLNWSHFRPKFAVKPEEDAEAHLHTNDWMNTHNFPGDIRVQRFCLTLVGKTRLWYESLRPIANDWQAFQKQFNNLSSNIQR